MTRNQWNQLGQDLPGIEAHDRFGYSISLSSNGRVVAVGAPYHNKGTEKDNWWQGQVQVFTFDENLGRWVHYGRPILGNDLMDRFGFSVRLSANGQLLAVGAPWNSEKSQASGELQQFRYHSATDSWKTRGIAIQGPDDGRWFGNSVIISQDGHTMGASLWGDHPFQPRLHSGGLYIYKLDPISDKLVAIGSGIPGQTMYDPESNSIALSGDGTIVFGAKGTGADTGIVRAYLPCPDTCTNATHQ